MDVVEPADAVVVHAPREDELALEALAHLGVSGEPRMQQLHGDALVQERVGRLEDDPVAPPADFAVEVKTAEVVAHAYQGSRLRVQIVRGEAGMKSAPVRCAPVSTTATLEPPPILHGDTRRGQAAAGRSTLAV